MPFTRIIPSGPLDSVAASGNLMRISLSWLRDLVRVETGPEELAEQLSMAGFEVEEIDDLRRYAEGVVVGYILSNKQHPEADRLSICSVDVGTETPLQVVCGAPNVRTGIYVPVALAGCSLPAVNLVIRPAILRGVVSEGMICSLTELSIADQSDGIAILDNLTIQALRPGDKVGPLLGLDDTILKLAITANRPDGLSMIGVAREVAALTNQPTSLPSLELNPPFDDFPKTVLNRPPSGELYSLSLIEAPTGQTLGQVSPAWIQQRLQHSGIKSVNVAVDVTNLVMLEQSQPLHAFDADALERLADCPISAADFNLRQAHDGEYFKGIDGCERMLNCEVQVVTCHDRPIALAGVMGSMDSRVTESTCRIWLEAALFTPAAVRRTARSTGLRTDASTRFEKGLPRGITLSSSARAATLLQEILGSTTSGRWVHGRLEESFPPISLRRQAIHRTLGLLVDNGTPRSLKDDEIERCLVALGCTLDSTREGWQVSIPHSRRCDLLREIDLVEEVARLVGYNLFEAKLPKTLGPGGLNPRQKAERELRKLLAISGFQEISTLSLVGPPLDDNHRVPLSNPLLTEYGYLRNDLHEEHLRVCQSNFRSFQSGCWIFEIGNLFSGSSDDIRQNSVLAGVISGERVLERWSRSGKLKLLSYFEARALVGRSLAGLKLDVSDRPYLSPPPLLHPGRCAELFLEGQVCGHFGQLHPSYAEDLVLPRETYLFQLGLNSILTASTRGNRRIPVFQPYPTVPSIDRDLAVLVPTNTASGDVLQVICRAGKPLLENVELVDHFESDNLKAGHCSQSYRLRFRGSGTLTDAQVLPIQQKIREALVQHFRAEPRS
ncbi:phenylalanine--tRNA ligase subunit beta [cyanobiont of Ornithocercus magnificus]|nr:phenylalanine--tRNA ligase subunit beta [cyanobiont of Ornithocercus magnificus]